VTLGGNHGSFGMNKAFMSILGTFQPETLMTGLAPRRSARRYLTTSVCDSPGNRVTSLPCQVEDWSSLSPASSWPVAVPRRTSARSRNETADEEVSVIVTAVVRSAPSCLVVTAVAVTEDGGSFCSACRFAYCEMTPDGSPSVLAQFTASGWVDSQ
jgi:hypothetical protein